MIPKIVQDYIEFVKKDIPTINIKQKESSKLMKTIGWLFKITKISPNFMEDYITTIGNTIYLPSNMESMPELNLLEIIVHECFHARDNKRIGPLFQFLYLFPQALSLLSLLALLAPFTTKFMLLWLAALMFLAPLPAPGRYWLELRAYRTSILFGKLLYKYSEQEMKAIRDFIILNLSERWYYFTFPFPRKIEEHLVDETFMNKSDYKIIIDYLKNNNLC